jgi:hypothetical protein
LALEELESNIQKQFYPLIFLELKVEMIVVLEQSGRLSCIEDEVQKQNCRVFFETRKPNKTTQNSKNWMKKTRADYQVMSKQKMSKSKKWKYSQKILSMNWIKESSGPRQQKCRILVPQNRHSKKMKPR